MTDLDPEFLLARLGQRAARPLWVAFSGGRDSHVLLHLAVAAGLSPRAVHVDHGLHPQSAAWAQHCQEVCRGLGVALTIRRITAPADSGQGPEAAARAARYQVFTDLLRADELLLTAHHRDDQAETVLLRILRGTGLRGIAGMPSERRLGRGRLFRPLLAVSRGQIADYAGRFGLAWVDDPSNAESDADRNFLRNRILPELQSRWPAASEMLTRLADQAGEDAELLDELAELDLEQTSDAAGLSVPALARLPRPRQRNALRRWLRNNDRRPPSAARLEAGLDALLTAAADREPVLRWDDGIIRRYRDALHLLSSRTAAPPQTAFAWDLHGVLTIPGIGRLTVTETRQGERLRADLQGRSDVTVQLRQGGERIQPSGSRHRRPLKTLFQEAGVPPWERRRTPLIYAGEALVCVGERWIAAEYAARGDEPGLRVRWLTED